jgi:hypothetical protein
VNGGPAVGPRDASASGSSVVCISSFAKLGRTSRISGNAVPKNAGVAAGDVNARSSDWRRSV